MKKAESSALSEIQSLPDFAEHERQQVLFALHHNLTLVARNTKDIAHTGVEMFDPWE